MAGELDYRHARWAATSACSSAVRFTRARRQPRRRPIVSASSCSRSLTGSRGFVRQRALHAGIADVHASRPRAGGRPQHTHRRRGPAIVGCAPAPARSRASARPPHRRLKPTLGSSWLVVAPVLSSHDHHAQLAPTGQCRSSASSPTRPCWLDCCSGSWSAQCRILRRGVRAWRRGSVFVIAAVKA